MPPSQLHHRYMREAHGRYYIIEHPTKGVLREVIRTGQHPVPRFSRMARRDNPKMLRFTYLPDAVKAADELIALPSNSGSDRVILMIRKAPHFKWRCWECGRWISTTTDRELGHHRSCPMVGGGD